MSDLSEMLSQLKALQNKIEIELHKGVKSYESRTRTKLFPSQDTATRFKKDLPSADNPYYLLTITFDPLVSNHLDEVGQRHKMISALNMLDKHMYYACLEKHKSGVIHAHALIICDHHKIQNILYVIRGIVSKSSRLHPSINIKPLKQSQADVDRSFDYIVQDKEDHPVYKYLQFNI